MDERVKPMAKRHAAAAAALHAKGISTGFLSSLGQRFLRQIYAAIPSCPAGFGYVWEEPDGRILGFIACAESTGRVYKQALVRRGFWMALVLARFVVRPSVVRRLIETLRYSAQVGAKLPPAEVLSIAVAEETRGKGIGKAIIAAAMEAYRRRGIREIKVAVGADNLAANEFYKRSGFVLTLTRQHHGLPMNVYVARLGDSPAAT